MYADNCPKKIHDYNSAMKLIFVLRDPVKRAISNFKWDISGRGVRKNLDTLISKRYIYPSLYGKHIERFMGVFDRCQVHIIISEKMFSD